MKNFTQLYKDIKEAKVDNFTKVMEKDTIYFLMDNESKVTEVKFYSIRDILGKIGGFNSLILAIFLRFQSLLWKNFLAKLAERIGGDKDEVMPKLKERISYMGIYGLYDENQKQKELISQL